MSDRQILVVDDERAIADTLVCIMNIAGYRCVAAYSAEEAMASIRASKPDLMISDVVMMGGNGVQLAIQVRRQWPTVKILLVSGNAVTQTIIETARAHGYAFELLAKPVPPKQLLLRVAALLLETRTDCRAETPRNCAGRIRSAL